MAKRKRSLAAGLFGAAAGIGAALPPLTCAGGACASCLACVGVGGVAASVLLVGLVSHRLRCGRAKEDNGSHYRCVDGDRFPDVTDASLDDRCEESEAVDVND